MKLAILHGLTRALFWCLLYSQMKPTYPLILVGQRATAIAAIALSGHALSQMLIFQQKSVQASVVQSGYSEKAISLE